MATDKEILKAASKNAQYIPELEATIEKLVMKGGAMLEYLNTDNSAESVKVKRAWLELLNKVRSE